MSVVDKLNKILERHGLEGILQGFGSGRGVFSTESPTTNSGYSLTYEVHIDGKRPRFKKRLPDIEDVVQPSYVFGLCFPYDPEHQSLGDDLIQVSIDPNGRIKETHHEYGSVCREKCNLPKEYKRLLRGVSRAKGADFAPLVDALVKIYKAEYDKGLIMI